ncbi:MAG: ATP-binding cassette domain-containing protein [Leptospirillum sp.]|jgi:oligopeptide/dipeptide ABC transporter ATP-binding protein
MMQNNPGPDTHRTTEIQTPESQSPYLLDVSHITRIFDKPRDSLFSRKETITALQDISFRIPRRSIVGLVGETGSGKTTLGRIVMRLIDPTSGSVIYNGQDLTALRKEPLRRMRKHFQMVFQDPYSSLDPRMTVRSILKEPLSAHDMLPSPKEEPQSLGDLLTRVGLRPSDLDRLPKEFSGGGRQRIGIARAIALKPELLVADEPIASLDVSIGAQIINLFSSLNKEDRMTLLFISHDLSVIRYLTDYVVILYRGLKVESGPTASVFSQPFHPYSKQLLSSLSGEPQGTTKRDNPEKEQPLLLPLCPFYDQCPERESICRTDPPPIRLGETDPSDLWPRDMACHKTL